MPAAEQRLAALLFLKGLESAQIQPPPSLLTNGQGVAGAGDGLRSASACTHADKSSAWTHSALLAPRVMLGMPGDKLGVLAAGITVQLCMV